MDVITQDGGGKGGSRMTKLVKTLADEDGLRDSWKSRIRGLGGGETLADESDTVLAIISRSLVLVLGSLGTQSDPVTR